MKEYIAHRRDDGTVQTVKEHLLCVAELAAAFASVFGAEEMGRAIGLMHDVGKYTGRFQRRITQDAKVDHSTAGGKELWARRKGGVEAISDYCILGHHGGLPNGGSMKGSPDSTMYGRLRKDLSAERLDDYTAYQQEISCPDANLPNMGVVSSAGFTLSFLTRMLFSCLVDADFLDTEAFMKSAPTERGGYDSIDVLWKRAETYLERFANPEKPLHRKRTEILNDCMRSAQEEPGLFTLTVPTGGGKTLSSLAFALKHAAKHGMRRVIYCIPYISIIEQNAGVFAEVLGEHNVLEHHASILYDNNDDLGMRHYLATENWDAPVIVTTNVQFFESIFGARTSACRKLHNIAGSVIIFDEAQMLPNEYLRPCLNAIAELTGNYGCTAVLCTATQPALNGLLPKGIQPREICGDVQGLYAYFRRTRIVRDGLLSDEELAERLRTHRQALCIVNTRKHAQALYALLPEEGRYHLSTTMTPQHRREKLKEIRERVREKLPCVVISTSLIECGVDIDLPVVYRAEAGLDSIIQAAGRCNREGGRSADESIVHVFTAEERYRPPVSLGQPLSAYLETARTHADDLAAPQAIQSYFSTLYHYKGEDLDRKGIVTALERGAKEFSFPFRDIARDFQMIGSDSRAVFIPMDEEAKRLEAELRAGVRNRQLMRQAGQYCVNLYRYDIRHLKELGLIEPLDEEMYVLSDMGCYTDAMGLTLSAEGGYGVFA